MPIPSRPPLGSLVLFSLLACAPEPGLDARGETGETGWGPDGPDDTGATREPVDLVDAGAWVATAATLDPLAEHRPELVICPSAAYGLEFGVLEVDTGQCNYLSVSQPLPDARGDPRPSRRAAARIHQPDRRGCRRAADFSSPQSRLQLLDSR